MIYDSYSSLMSYDTYKSWRTRINSGKSWFDEKYNTKVEINWRPRIENFYEYQSKSSYEAWKNHVDSGGSHWTLFDKYGGQMSVGSSKRWKNTIQQSVRDLMKKDEYNVKLYIAPKDDESTDSGSEFSDAEDDTNW